MGFCANFSKISCLTFSVHTQRLNFERCYISVKQSLQEGTVETSRRRMNLSVFIFRCCDPLPRPPKVNIPVLNKNTQFPSDKNRTVDWTTNSQSLASLPCITPIISLSLYTSRACIRLRSTTPFTPLAAAVTGGNRHG